MIADIADEAGVPRKFLEQILLGLKKRGIVRSVRGRQGGYLLGRSPQDITFADVIREIDGPLALAPCVSVTAYHRCEDCKDETTCAIRKVLLAARDATADVLEIAHAGFRARFDPPQPALNYFAISFERAADHGNTISGSGLASFFDLPL